MFIGSVFEHRRRANLTSSHEDLRDSAIRADVFDGRSLYISARMDI